LELITVTHTYRRTVDRTLDEGSARRRDLYLVTQHLQGTFHALGEIRTRNPSKRAAADLRLRRHGHWDHLLLIYLCVLDV